MNIQIDRQKTDMALVLHICVRSLKDSMAVFVGLVMDQLENMTKATFYFDQVDRFPR